MSLSIVERDATDETLADASYPDRFVVQPNETVEEAQAKVDKQRKCAKTYSWIGAVGGTVTDIVTTQSNQKAGFQEINLAYGKHASVKEMLFFHGLTGGFGVWRIGKLAKRDPARACRAAKVFAAISFLPGAINAAVRVRF